ncbi:MAG: hypothetical protein E4G94_11890, partial [ANME-2 cluster archaeon]
MTLPKENLDTRTYEDLVKEAVSRIPVYAPEWTDHNVYDPGRTFIELFVWLAEMQIYSLNRITDRSRRKFLKLIGIPELRPAKAATVDFTFSVLNGTPTCINEGTIVVASDPLSGEDIPFETQQDLTVIDAELTKILVHPTWFCWDDIPGNDDERLIRFLNTRFGIEWAEIAKIEKIDNDRTIKLYFENNSLSLRLNDEKTKGNLEIDDCRTDEFTVETKDGKINVYQNYIDRSDANKNENVHYYAFRSKPELGDELFLGFDKDPGKDITLTFYLFEDRLAEREEEPKLFPSGKVRWEYCIGGGNGECGWKSVEEIHDETNHLSKSGKVRINIKDPPMGKAVIEDNDLFWLRCMVKDQNYDIPVKIDQIRLNTVCAVQRSRVEQDKFSGSGLPDFSFDIKHIPVLDTKQDDEKSGITDGYLFSWNEIPGNDNERLIGFLKKRFN